MLLLFPANDMPLVYPTNGIMKMSAYRVYLNRRCFFHCVLVFWALPTRTELRQVRIYAALGSNILTGGHLSADLEKVVKDPQVENSEIYIVLKLAWFITNGDQKYFVLWYYEILKLWLSILNRHPSTLNFEFSILHSPSFYIKYLHHPNSIYYSS